MIRPEVHGFLGRELPGLLGVVGTNSEDGVPHLVPVWYRWDGARIHVWTHESRIWVRNLARDPRAGFSVQEPAEPYAAVPMKGRAASAAGDDAPGPGQGPGTRAASKGHGRAFRAPPTRIADRRDDVRQVPA